MKIEEDITLLDQSAENSEMDDDENDGSQYRYYKSKRVLGELFRAIDEYAILGELQNSKLGLPANTPNIIRSLWSYVRHHTAGFQWKHHLSAARDIKEM